MPDRHQMLHIYLTLQWRPFLSAIITCEMNSIIFLVVNTVCELFSWRMYFLSMTLLLFLNCLQAFCQSIVIMLMLWHFSANQISFLIVTGMLIGYWKTIIVLSVLHSQGTYFSLVPVLFGILLDLVGILLEETLVNVEAWANHTEPDERFWNMDDISGNRHAPENPKTTLVHAKLTSVCLYLSLYCNLACCFWECCLRCFS